MNKIPVSIKLLRPDAQMPQYATAMSTMADICAHVEATAEVPMNFVLIEPGATAVVRTGIALRPAPGYATKVYPRSGLAKKHSITLQNAVGVIDHDYPDELCLLVRNEGSDIFEVKHGMRIAQLEVHPVVQGEFAVVDELPAVQLQAGDMARVGGFGSTGTGEMAQPTPADDAPDAQAPDAQAARSLLLGQLMHDLGELLMELSIESPTGVTHATCEEVGAALRGIGQTVEAGVATCIAHDKEMVHHIAQRIGSRLTKL